MVLIIDAQVAGISGDMILSSLVSLGADKSRIIEGIYTAESFLDNSKIINIDFVSVQKNGKDATQLILEVGSSISFSTTEDMIIFEVNTSSGSEQKTVMRQYAIGGLPIDLVSEWHHFAGTYDGSEIKLFK